MVGKHIFMLRYYKCYEILLHKKYYIKSTIKKDYIKRASKERQKIYKNSN